MFDNYTLKARFYPVVIFFFPLILVGVFYSFEFKTVLHLLSSLGLVGALTYLFSQLGRDKGKLKEPALWQEWGGTPSIQIMRLKDGHIDEHTKKRYHQKLQLVCPVLTVPSLALESTDPSSADEIYRAWTKYLISQTRDTKKYPLLLKDNISYGFRRNLWGLKSNSLIFVVCLVVANYTFWAIKKHSFNILLFPDSYLYSSASLLLVLLFWVFVIKASWVKVPAFSYAERLCEATETLGTTSTTVTEKKIITL